MLKRFTSCSLNTLADRLIAELQQHPSENPLMPETFVVQNFGMARWLSLYIAEKQGVAANLEFKFPAEIYWQIMRVMDPGIPEDLPSERIPMTWAIFDILRDNKDPSLSTLQRYVANEDPKKQEMRCWNLAGRIADVFDQYLTYRPGMPRKWEKNKLLTRFDSEIWQAHLWRKLVKQWENREKREGVHRATLGKTLISKIAGGAIATDKLPARITVFGVSEMPEMYIKTLVRLAKYTNVYFYSVDASRNQANTLIQSLGKVGTEYEQLINHHVREDEHLQETEHVRVEEQEPKQKNRFQAVKAHLVGSYTPESIPDDDSIMIHSCHSPRREVEVLYDQLLHMLDENEDLQPADIMVLCPQMDNYGSEIEAIFGAVEQGMPEIPYHMAETASESNVVDLMFRKLLNVADSRFKVTDILDLLDSKPIRHAFALSNDDTNTLEQWIGDNRIHWGINGDQKQELNLPATDSFTWQAGLRRMMSGYAMQQAENSLFQQIYPYDEIQQTEHAQLLGRFSHFLQKLFEAHRQVQKPKSLTEWKAVFNDWISDFFPKDENYFRDLQKLRKMVQSLSEQQELARMKSPVSYGIIRSYLENQLDQKATGGGRPGRGVTFSGMVPMRNIPANVICMIGMNDGAFPRGKEAVEFNLITKDPQRGDRLPGKEDRQIFLENILAARNRIYFSYTGQSNKKEVEYPPSVVLREFIDYLGSQYKIDVNKIIKKHKLQSFSNYYFKNNSNLELFSYSAKSREIAEKLRRSSSKINTFLPDSLPEPDESFKKLSVSELISFFQHPARFLLQQRLGIFLREDNVLDEDREDFELGGLGRYHIGQEMLNRYLDEKSSMPAFKAIAKAKDLLPEGWPGDQAFEMQEREVKEFGRMIEEELNYQQLDSLEIELKIGEFQIVGHLDQIYEHRQLLFRFGSMRAKDLIELWLKHLLLQSAKRGEYSTQSRLYTRHKKQGMAFFQFISIDNYRDILEKLLQMYWTGLQRDILFYPNSSFAFAEKVIYKNKDDEEGFKAADREWIDRYNNYEKEGDDAYIKRLNGGRNPFEDNDMRKKFKQVSRYFWSPFFKELNKTEEGGL